ncbi:agarase [Thalassotalea litorea]|uniref:agarase n=1 Tax=Thalassotalea litorea TaxID=2020715 RepID=UPI0037358826
MNQNKTKRLSIKSVVIAGLITCLSSCSDSDSNSMPPLADKNADVFLQEQVLLDLLGPDDAGNVPDISAETAKISQQQNQLEIEFKASEHISAVTLTPQSPWQLSVLPAHNLAFDVTNTGTESIHFYLEIANPDEDVQKRSISIPVGFSGTVYFPLSGKEALTDTGMWGDAPPWKTEDQLMIWRSWRASQVDMSSLAQLRFFTIGLLNDQSLTLSNIRIRENPESDPDWMKHVVDEYGQNTKVQTSLHVTDDAELVAQAKQQIEDFRNNAYAEQRSKFGGFSQGPKLEGTGYFRVAKHDGKWWMVDPEGYLFFSHGPANVRMANLSTLTGVDYKDDSIRYRSPDEVTPEDSIGIVNIPEQTQQTSFVTLPLRHQMFRWLPSYDQSLAKHYSYRRSTHKGPIAHGETFNFYRANLERKYGDDFMQSWYETTMKRMKHWGFTSFGNWVDPQFYRAQQVPYFANGWIIGDFQTLSGKVNHWGKMPDPFDPVFAQRAKITIERISEQVKNSPWCAGIFIDNEKSWGERQGSVEARYGVILDALSKDALSSPAKAAFMVQLQQQYSTIVQLNQAWNTQFTSWQQLASGATFDDYTQAHVDDLSALLTRLGEQYFIVVHNTLEQVMPNHLYMGARMANWGMPDEIIKASVTYSDVLSFNIYEDGVQEHHWKFLESVDLPVVIGEFHIGTATDSGLYNPGIVHASDQQDRARKYKAYMQSVIEKPYMVGAHWFQYVDEPITGRAFDGENANIGLVNVTDTPYPELIEAVQQVTASMYQKRLGTQ